MNGPGRAALVSVVAIALAGGLALSVAGGTAAIEEPSDGYFLVELDADGDAAVEYTNHTDLNDDDQREWYEAVRDDAEAQASVAERRRGEMQFVTDRANEEVDREIRVGEVSVETETDGDVGIVTYRFEWENLAAVDGDRVVLSVPFSLYTEFDRELVVVAPDGYELTSATPEPEHRNETTASWPGLTELTGFEVVATGRGGDGADGDGTFGAGTGFGVPLAVGSLLAATMLARRRR